MRPQKPPSPTTHQNCPVTRTATFSLIPVEGGGRSIRSRNHPERFLSEGGALASATLADGTRDQIHHPVVATSAASLL